MFITTFLNFTLLASGSRSTGDIFEVWFQVKIYNGDNVIATTPDISRQLQVINSDGGSNRSNTINNLSYIIDNVNITGSLNIKLYMKTDAHSTILRFNQEDDDEFGRGFFNIEFIEYD
jgi:hypothetical protein